MWRYHNPVAITFGPGTFEQLPRLIAGRPYVLVTYGEPVFTDMAARLNRLAGAPTVTVDTVLPNPDFAQLPELCSQVAAAKQAPGVIVALGGGSVIDTAKAISAAGHEFAVVRQWLETGDGFESLQRLPIIAVPTTAGTGSEVTCGAALWDSANGKKYSLFHPHYYPEHAVVDPELLLALPQSITIATALDALSHALESLWNVNANPITRGYAIAAAGDILDALPHLAEDLSNLPLRTRVARGAVRAGLAMSNTKTALAHGLSYPMTLRYGMPHGIACSFSLPVVMQAALGADADCDDALREIFGKDLESGALRLRDFLTNLGVSVAATDHGASAADWEAIITAAFSGDRGQNYIGTQEKFEAALNAF